VPEAAGANSNCYSIVSNKRTVAALKQRDLDAATGREAIRARERRQTGASTIFKFE
jgi:hypothetical protein